jgi:hypothetical protein
MLDTRNEEYVASTPQGGWMRLTRQKQGMEYKVKETMGDQRKREEKRKINHCRLIQVFRQTQNVKSWRIMPEP